MMLHTIQIDNSSSTANPVIFLHGFGGAADQWRGLQTTISYKAPTLAMDLPGHGASLDYPNAGPPKIAAKAVLAEMDALNIETAHIVGHSMGGAIAALIGLIAPKRVSSLTLLAPGGFGTEFNHPLLLKWAAANSREELKALMPNFYGSSFDLPEKIIDFQHELRSEPGANEMLTAIAQSMSNDGKQGMLPVESVLAGDYPISVIWGREDKILPVSHGQALVGKVDLHLIDRMGHSPAVEAPELVRDVILKQLKNTG